MNPAGALLDTGPLVALLSRTDENHGRAKALFRSFAPPFRTCEAVLVEASRLLSKNDPGGPADIVRLGGAGLLAHQLVDSGERHNTGVLRRRRWSRNK